MSIAVLRAHWGTVGKPPTPLPPPQKFETAFAGALSTPSLTDFRHLAPTLLINSWDPADLLLATPDALRPRLRFLVAMAGFLIDYNPRSIPVPDQTEKRVEEMVEKIGCGWDPFNLSSFPTPTSFGFIEPSYECVRWKLVGFARSWSATRQKNRQMLNLYDQAVEFGIRWNDADNLLKMPIPERIVELERFIKEFEADMPRF